MRTHCRIAIALCMAVLGFTAGCSRQSTEDHVSTTPTGEVNQTRTTLADVKLPSAVSLATEDTGSDGTASLASARPTDADDSDTDGPASNASRSAVDLPFSPVVQGPTHAESREMDRRGDQDDPDAPVISVAVSPVAQQIAMLNNGRGDTVAAPTRRGPARPQEPAEPSGSAISSTKPPAANLAPDPTARVDSALSAAASAADAPAAKSALSEEFGPLDQDDDGQIGLYEWPREKLADFQRLDANQDGFLTPGELTP